jgi:hypothetical protein
VITREQIYELVASDLDDAAARFGLVIASSRSWRPARTVSLAELALCVGGWPLLWAADAVRRLVAAGWLTEDEVGDHGWHAEVAAEFDERSADGLLFGRWGGTQ